MEIRLIDAIGPFFRGVAKKRINWSKILFAELDPSRGIEADAFWRGVEEDMRCFVERAKADGYTAVTLDDVAHLTHHPIHGEKLRAEIRLWRERYRPLFQIIRNAGLGIYLTSDVLTLPLGLDQKLRSRSERSAYYRELLEACLCDWPELDGLILRLGECDGLDVQSQFRSHLFLRTAREANRFLLALLPVFEAHQRQLVVRTWTVGAHPIGDLIWHRDTLQRTFRGLGGAHFTISMKYGESDFFRYLPVNGAFARLEQRKLVEFQARREYEGAGEFPSFLGWEVEAVRQVLDGVENLVGFSVWCQTGGWHGFRRRAYIDPEAFWIDLNSAVIARVMGRSMTMSEALRELVGEENFERAVEFLRLADRAVRRGLYIEEFAARKLFFRRVRIPPLLHIYWDCLFFNHPVRKVLRYFIKDPERALEESGEVLESFPRMLELAEELGWPVGDIRFMRDSFEIFHLARIYYFGEFDGSLIEQIRKQKKAYKKRYPRGERQRYRIKTDFQAFPVRGRTLARAFDLFIRQKRGYRLFDRLVTLQLLSWVHRLLGERQRKHLPDFLKKSAMGIDSVFK